MYDRDAIIAAVDLRVLADELLGPHSGTAQTPTWRCPDSEHQQTGRTPPVNIFTSRRGEQRWRCHACGEGGTAIDLVMACRHIDIRDALDLLARRVGQHEQPAEWTPAPRRPITADTRESARGCNDQAGMDRYINFCAGALFAPEGQRIHQWLTEARGLPDDVLRANKIGADLGPRRQPRPDGMPRTGGAVLPVLVDGHAVYAQIRVPNPRGDGPRYLNPTSELAPNPRMAHFQPADQRHPEVVVTEGTIDALSAATAGYRSIAVLSASYPDQVVAHTLSRLPDPLVLAFDQDDAGQAAAERLTTLLEAQLRPPANLILPEDDLNESLVHSTDWPKEMSLRVNASTQDRGVEVGRSLA